MILAGAAPAVRANERDEARVAFRSGSQHYKLGEFKEALADFKEAYRKVEDSVFLFNIAQCERQLGMRSDAIREYKIYLSDSPNASNRDEVKRIIATLEAELKEERDSQRAAAEREAATKATAPAPAAVDLRPAAVASKPASEAATTAPMPAKGDQPLYKKWWLWTVVGVVAAGAAATGVAIALTHDKSAPSVMTALGTAHPF